MEEGIPRATTVVAAGTWPEDQARDSVTVDFDDRYRRRRLYTADGGLAFLLDLPEAQFVVTGALGPDSNAHGPNEYLDVTTARRITRSVAHLLHSHATR